MPKDTGRQLALASLLFKLNEQRNKILLAVPAQSAVLKFKRVVIV